MNIKQEKQVSNNNRTKVIQVEKKQRRRDTIGWLIGAIIILIVLVFAAGRLTLIGQFLDDVIFSFVFGWFKYLVYFIMLVLSISLLAGVRIRMHPAVRGITICWVLLICWMIANILLFVDNANHKIPLWDANIFVKITKNYVYSWYDSSIFQPHHGALNFAAFNGSWVTIAAGGGIIGSVIAGIFSYLTVVVSFLLCLFAMVLVGAWTVAGHPFAIFHKKFNLWYHKKITGNKAAPVGTWDETVTHAHQQVMPAHLENHTLPGLTGYEPAPLSRDMVDELINPDYATPDQLNTGVISNEMVYNPTTNEIQNYQPINKGVAVTIPTKDQYIMPRRNQFNEMNGLESAYGNGISLEEARARLNSETQLSPFSKNLVPVTNQVNNSQPVQPTAVNKNLKTINFNTTQPVSPYGHNPNRVQPAFNSEQDIDDAINNTNTFHDNQFMSSTTRIEPTQHPSQTINFEDTPSNNPRVSVTTTSNISPDALTQSEILDPTQTMDDLPTEVFEQRTVVDTHVVSPSSELKPTSSHIPAEYLVERKPEPKKPLPPKSKVTINKAYQLPPVELLDPKQVNNVNREINIQSAKEKAQHINQIFETFGCGAKVINAVIGPTVTKFEIGLDPGVKVNKIISLESDLKLALATPNVRMEAPIQGKSAVGLEIANERSNKVPIRDLIEHIPDNLKDNKLTVVLGETVTGDLLFAELNKMPHLLIAGSTGSGKSVCVNTIIGSLIMRAKPHEVKLLLIDPKQVELAVYNDLPHLLAPVISDTKQANSALKKITAEMDNRYALLTQNGARNIEAYNRKMTKPEDKMPYIVVIIDELADLMITAGREVEESIMRITQLARAAGIHLIIATQRPSTNIITGVIKNNVPSRIAFSVASGHDSRTILDHIGAEKLIGQGDMLYAPSGQNHPIRAQGAFVSDEEIERLVDYVKEQQEAQYEEEFLNLEKDYTQNSMFSGEVDELYEEVKQFIVLSQKASTSLIQRKFGIGYNRASRIIEAMEEDGVIGPQNGAKPREVFIKPE